LFYLPCIDSSAVFTLFAQVLLKYIL